MSRVSCIGCGALVDDITGPVHAYMTAAPGCWALHGRLLVRSLEWGAGRGTVQYRTDAYAAHAAAIERWARSVWDGWAAEHAQIRSLLAEYGLKEADGVSHRP